MLESLQGRIRRLLKVPPEPDPPLGEPSSVRVFRAAPGFLRYRLLAWGWKQVAGLIGLVAGVQFFQFGLVELAQRRALSWVPWSWIELGEYLVIAGFVIQVGYSLVLVTLDFRYRWYMITDRSLRIREGLWKVQERTMTFSNVQNVTIRQGPLQRLLGIADLRVQTAGGGGKSSDDDEEGSADHLHVGYFRGVANAAEIRDAVLARLRRLRSSGLGDPEEPVPVEAVRGTDQGVLEAAAELLRETRSLAAAWRQR
ncbi:MAG: PH domain-containing protein [Thermoanaerobaculia bacterium]